MSSAGWKDRERPVGRASPSKTPAPRPGLADEAVYPCGVLGAPTSGSDPKTHGSPGSLEPSRFTKIACRAPSARQDTATELAARDDDDFPEFRRLTPVAEVPAGKTFARPGRPRPPSSRCFRRSESRKTREQLCGEDRCKP